MASNWPSNDRPGPSFDITKDDSYSDSDKGSGKEDEKSLIKPEKKCSTTNEFRRVSTNCLHPKVPCPTCKGKGKLSQAQSDTMLALIPVHDNRLRPKRTTLKLVIAFCLILLTGGLCFAFLYPRKVYLSINSAGISNYSYPQSKSIAINMTVNVYINNTNFFTVDVSNISAQILFMSTPERAPREVGNAQFSAEHLGIREERQVGLLVRTLYSDKEYDIIVKMCSGFENNGDWDYYFPIKISMTALLKYWTHTEQIENSKIYYVQCESVSAIFTKKTN